MWYYIDEINGDMHSSDDYYDSNLEDYQFITEDKLEAYEYAYNLKSKYADSEIENSDLLIDKWTKLTFELLWKYEPDKLRTMPAWRHDLVKEVTRGAILL